MENSVNDSNAVQDSNKEPDEIKEADKDNEDDKIKEHNNELDDGDLRKDIEKENTVNGANVNLDENKNVTMESEDIKETNHERYRKLDEDEAMKENRRGSNYTQNIKISNSSAGLVLPDKGKDGNGTLLPDPKTVARFSPVWKQTLASSASILLTFAAGLTSGYSAILLPQLKEADSVIKSTPDTDSWIAAMAALPMAPGCLISGWMMEKFGRKTSHYMICAPFLLGWILIACASDLSLMLLGRFFTGLCVGLLGPLGPVYIAETSEPKFRGFFLAGVSLAIAVGIFVAHILGTYLTWHWTAAICTVFPVLSVVLLTLVPESPTWLISKGQIDEGVKSFYWLRGYGEAAKLELKGLIDKQKVQESEPPQTLKEKLVNLKSPVLVKPLLIMILFFITCQFSGVNAVAFYSIDIVEKAVGKNEIDHYLCMLIIDAIRVVMSIVACVVCKQYGRRPLCFISGVWTALSMLGLALYLYVTDNGKLYSLPWIPLVCLSMYIIAVSIGLVPLPWIMCGEVFPSRVRGLGSGISSATTFAAFFVVVKTNPAMLSRWGEVYTFLFYGVIALLGTVLMYFILPETKGKSLQEIEDRFRHGNKPVSKA